MQNTVDTSIGARRAVLEQVRGAGPHTAPVMELVARFAADLATDEARELVGRRGDDPRSDHELLVAIFATGPHCTAVELLVRTHAALLADFDRSERELPKPRPIRGASEYAEAVAGIVASLTPRRGA